MGKVIVDKPNTGGLIGPDGTPLTSSLPDNLPEFMIIGINFINKITQEPEYAAALVFPAREYLEKLKDNPKEIELVQMEAIINAFARELYEKDSEMFNKLGDAQELHKHLVANYEIVMSMPILANNILQINFSSETSHDDNEEKTPAN